MFKEEILSKFNIVKKSGKEYMGLCPAHADKNPSLCITFENDKVLLHCFAGCECESILNAVGLTKSDLYINNEKYHSSKLKETEYTYKYADGKTAYTKIRNDYEDGTKKFVFISPDGRKGIKGISHIPYNLPEVSRASTVYFVEGEKCADAVINEGYVATTLDCGANSPKMSDSDIEFFKNKKVVILPDNDKAGMQYAERIKNYMPWAVIKKLPELSEKDDIYDWLKKGHTMEEIENLPETVIDSDDTETGFFSDKRNQSTIMLDIIKNENVELFFDETNTVYIAVPIDKHKEIYALSSNDFDSWARYLFYKKTNKIIRKEGVTEAKETLAAEAKLTNKPNYKLSTRVAENNGEFWYDLSNKNWSAIKITHEDWNLVENVPILFQRYRHQKPQVNPQSGGDINQIFDYINIKEYKTLFLCWLVSCFVPDIPHPMPIFYGEKGAAKSTACKILKGLIDPSAFATLPLSKDEKTFIINLHKNYFIPFDNVSTLNAETSDRLCRAITGDAIQQRKLYTDDEDCIFVFMRCLAINGITNVANKSDLLDRSILFELERVSSDKRREIQEIQTAFENDRPFILGAVFDTLSKAMQIYPNVKLDKLTRMADFCRWGYAIAEALGIGGQVFLNEYKSNQSIQNDEAINSDLVAYLIVKFMHNTEEWTGKISTLLNELQKEAEKNGINPKNKSMPQAPNNLSRRIKAVKSNLEAVSIEFEINTKKSDGTYITLKNNKISPLPPYNSFPNSFVKLEGGDENGDTETNQNLSQLQNPVNIWENESNGDNEDENIIF